jgi:hypothetical protein
MRRLQRIPAIREGIRGGTPSVGTALAVHGEGALGEVGDIWDDIGTLAKKAPQVIQYVVKIVNKAQPYLPQIVQVIDTVGAQLPQVLAIIQKVQPYLPKVIAIVDKYGSRIPEILKKVEPHIPTIIAVAEDPALPLVINRVETIRQIEAAKAVKKAAKKPPPPPGVKPSMESAQKKVGLALHRVVPALDAYIYIRKNPWVPWVAGGGAVLLLMGIGFGVGRLTAPKGSKTKEKAPARAPARVPATAVPAPAMAGRRQRYVRRRD